MNREVECAVVRDLLPNYVEQLTEPATTAFVQQHLAECADCRAAKQAMTGVLSPAEQAQSDMMESLRRARRRRTWQVRLIIGVLVAAICVCFLPLPRRVNHTIPCVRWWGDREDFERVNVTVQGTYLDFLWLTDRYTGYVIIEGEEATQPPHHVENLEMDAFTGAMLSYENDIGMLRTEGSMAASPGMKEVMILWNDEDNGWDGQGGQVITGPAATREDAVAQTKDICRKYCRWLTNARWEGGQG